MVGVAVVGSNWFDGLCVCGSVDGLCLCVWLCCGWVLAEVVGSSGFLMSFFFFFFNMVFCSGGILVSSGQWWLGFFWVFVPIGFSGLIIGSNWFDGLCMCGSV